MQQQVASTPMPFDEPEERSAESFGPLPTAFVYRTKTGDTPHVVIRLEAGTLACTCKAYLSIEARPAGCWAMRSARRLLGLPTA